VSRHDRSSPATRRSSCAPATASHLRPDRRHPLASRNRRSGPGPAAPLRPKPTCCASQLVSADPSVPLRRAGHLRRRRNITVITDPIGTNPTAGSHHHKREDHDFELHRTEGFTRMPSVGPPADNLFHGSAHEAVARLRYLSSRPRRSPARSAWFSFPRWPTVAGGWDPPSPGTARPAQRRPRPCAGGPCVWTTFYIVTRNSRNRWSSGYQPSADPCPAVVVAVSVSPGAHQSGDSERGRRDLLRSLTSVTHENPVPSRSGDADGMHVRGSPEHAAMAPPSACRRR
jgi:hypothetical protein